MKAAIRTNYGGPNAINIQAIEKPQLGPNEVLIKVYATTVNRTDCAILTGQPFIMRFLLGLRKPKVASLGTDFAGVIEAVGSEVTKFYVDDRVFGFKDEGLNSQAEYMTFSEDDPMALIPDNISFEEAAASIEGAHYAINTLNKIELNPQQKILVNGATGAIGSALLQLLKHQNINTTVVCNTKNKGLMKALGADKLFDYTKEDFTKDEQLYDYVFDAVGKSTFGKCKPILKEKGVYISSELGPYAQNIFFSLITPFFGGKKVKFPFPKDIQYSLNFMKDLLEQKKFKPVIDRSYPLEKISDAYTYVSSGQKTGNVILNIN